MEKRIQVNTAHGTKQFIIKRGKIENREVQGLMSKTRSYFIYDTNRNMLACIGAHVFKTHRAVTFRLNSDSLRNVRVRPERMAVNQAEAFAKIVNLVAKRAA